MNRFSKQHGAISAVRPQVGGDLFGIMVLLALLAIFSLIGCQDSFMKQTTADKTSAIASLTAAVDEAGNITASFDPNSGQTQVLKLASGALSGSAVAIPPGSLAIPVSITVGEGETLASSTFTQQIGLTDNAVSAAGPSVSFIPSKNVQATSPFTLSLPFSITSLRLTGIDTENVIVMFRAIKVEGDQTSYEMGVIPRSEVTISSDKVSFQTKQFGVFQLAKAEKKITQRVVQNTIEVPVLKKEVGNPLLGAWELCRVDSESGSIDSGSTTGGTTESEITAPIQWMNVASNGYFDSQENWTSKVSLNWSGGRGPFTVSRYTGMDCSGTRTDFPSLPNNNLEDTSLPAAKMVYYQLTDSQAKVSECHGVQVLTKPEKIRWSSVEYGAATVTANWEGPGKDFILMTYSQPSCQGAIASPTTQNKSYTFNNLTAVRSVKIRVQNAQVMSSCLDLKAVQSFLPSLGGGSGSQPVGENFITSVLIKSPAIFGGDSSVVVKFAAIGASYTARRFSAPDCSDASAVKSFTPLTNGIVGTIEDLIQAADMGLNKGPSYLLEQSGTTYLSQCVNFLPIDNRNPALRIYGVISNPTSVGFNWSPEVVRASNVELYKHVGEDCVSEGTKLTLDPSGSTPGPKIASLDQSRHYSFKLKTTDDSAPDVCFNAKTTDGDPPFIIPKSSTTILFSAATNVTDNKSHFVLLTSRAFQQTEKFSLPFDKTSASTDLLKASDPGLINQGLSLLAPMGCQFMIGSKQFGQIPLTELNTVYDPKADEARVNMDGLLVQCNGSDGGYVSGGNQQEGGDVGALGRVPGRAYSRLNRLKIGKDAYTMRQDIFVSKDCTGFSVSSNTEQGSFALPAVDVGGTIPIDVTQKDLDGSIFTKEGVDIANKFPSQFGCGLSGWIKDIVRKLGDSKCGGGEIGRTRYERLKVDVDRLYMCSSGQNKDYGSTADLRIPSCEITSDTATFTRQK